MKAFKFPLTKLLKYRTDMTESAKLALAGKTGAIGIQQRKIEESLAASKENFVASRQQFDVQSLRHSELYDSYQVRKRDEAKLQIRRLESERQEVLRLYQERLKAQLVLEHLKERAYRKYKKEQQRVEQIRLDDLVNSLVHADKKEEGSVGDKDGRVW